jgi:hypothetical protein
MDDQTAYDATITTTPIWRQTLLARLERGMGRALVDADRASLAWNESAGTLTVQSSELLTELRARGLVSNVFRSRMRQQ